MSLPETQLSDDDGSPSPSLIMQQAQAERPIMNMQTEHPFQNMQTELQSKGAVLTKAWSDLFSFITRYQAELVVKENSVEMAEKEINMRKWHLDEMKPVVDAGNEEITKLQEEIQTSQRLLNRTQSELTVKEQMLQSVRSDLNCNMEMLDKSRSELLGKQTEVVRYRADLERLKSELTIQQEQISIKDNLLKKLQNQLMKENAELKEQLDNERQTLELERNYHELTKMDLRKSKALLKSSGATSKAVIEIPDSPPTLDLSIEQEDSRLSNIISMAEDQYLSHHRLSQQDYIISDRFSDLPSQRISPAATSLNHPKKRKISRVSPSLTLTSPMQKSSDVSPDSMGMSDSLTHVNYSPMSSASDTFFPLTVSQDEENKSGIDPAAGAMMMDTQRDLGMMPGTPSSGASDSNQGPPVPISGPIPAAGMSVSPGGLGGDGKFLSKLPKVLENTQGVPFSYKALRCRICGKHYYTPYKMKAHMRSHTGERPFKCVICNNAFHLKHHLKAHLATHAKP
ncbi:sal-like protein 1 isoform X2 [Lineus longissimus]|uniref:sal-like protein 1 isoform X2 n=1 Tax=Lineus longissimus TaxID=88925 RepID=UPI00315DC98C